MPVKKISKKKLNQMKKLDMDKMIEISSSRLIELYISQNSKFDFTEYNKFFSDPENTNKMKNNFIQIGKQFHPDSVRRKIIVRALEKIDSINDLKGSGKPHLIQRIGSKTNDIKYFYDYLPLDVKNVVEPFGGSFALIRDVYSDDKYNKYVNDLDPELYYVYKHTDELIDGLKKWNIINEKNISVKDKVALFEKQVMNDFIKKYILKTSIVRGIANTKNLEKIEEDIKLIKKINFSNEDGFKIIERFRKKKDTFIFLDPPYLFSDNSGYYPQNENSDMTSYFFKFLDIFKDKTTKAKIMLIINDLAIIRELYKDFIVGSYEKIYQASKKKMNHLIIANY